MKRSAAAMLLRAIETLKHRRDYLERKYIPRRLAEQLDASHAEREASALRFVIDKLEGNSDDDDDDPPVGATPTP